MIPSDHFVRYYNEVFKALQECGEKHLVAYWREIGRLQTRELGEKFRTGGIKACYEYWKKIQKEENCDATLTLTDDYFEFIMHRCPSLAKVLDNDSEACPLYCDHCGGWIKPVMEYAGLSAVLNMESPTEPHCRFRVYTDKSKADEFEKQAQLVPHPYELKRGE